MSARLIMIEYADLNCSNILSLFKSTIRYNVMKWTVVIALVLILTAVSAFAGGGKVRGEKGKGSVHQVVGP